jgi:TonB family protein
METRNMNKYFAAFILIGGSAIFAPGANAQDIRHLTQEEASKMATAKPQPSYPPMAKQLRLEGRVEIEANISEAGNVESVKVLSGNAVLTAAAADAMKRWKFQPITVDGKPSRAVATVDFVFKL